MHFLLDFCKDLTLFDSSLHCEYVGVLKVGHVTSSRDPRDWPLVVVLSYRGRFAEAWRYHMY